MPRNRVPVVGTRGLHVAQLSPKVRSILKRRADAAARREYAPVLQADRAAFGGANKRFQGEKKSIIGATDMAENSLSQALRGLKGTGLSGRYLRQATSELTARRGDVAGAIPFLVSDAAKERGEAIEEARSQLISDRADMQQSAAAKFNSALAEERNAASSLLKERAEDRAEARAEAEESQFDPRALQNAKLALTDALTAWKQNPEVEDPDGELVPLQSLNQLKSIEEWRSFAKGLTEEYEGFDMVDAMEVVRRMIAKRRMQVAGPYRSESSAPAIRRDATPRERRIRPPGG